jgi:hypothetical protein
MTGYREKSLIDWVESESKLMKRQLGSEMEFLDISLAKDSILLFHAIHTVRSTGEFKRPHTLLFLNNPLKEIRETRNMNSIL